MSILSFLRRALGRSGAFAYYRTIWALNGVASVVRPTLGRLGAFAYYRTIWALNGVASVVRRTLGRLGAIAYYRTIWVLNGVASVARRVVPLPLKKFYHQLGIGLHHGVAIGVPMRKLLVRRTARIVRSRLRRRRYGAIPPADARSALILGQTLSTLDVTQHVLDHYCQQIFQSARLPPLELVSDLRQSLSRDGMTAHDYLRHAVRRAPNYAEAWCELGRVLLEQGNAQGAIAALTLVQYSDSYADPDRQPENVYNVVSSVWVKAWYYLGQAEEQLGRPQRALEAYAEALILEPGAALVRGAVAEILLSQGRVSKSLSYWTAALHAMPVLVSLPKAERDLARLPDVISMHRERVGNVQRKTA